MTPHAAKDRPFVGQPGYGGVSEGSVGEQGPPDEPEETPPSAPDHRRGPPDEDDEDDARDEAPKLELPKIGVPVDVT